MGVTAQVLLLAAPPLVALLVVSGLLLAGQLRQVRNFNRVAQLSSLTTEVGALVHELQKERGMSRVVLSSKGAQFRREMLAQRGWTDLQLTALARLSAGVAAGSGLADRLAAVRADLDRLPALRRRVDALDVVPSASFGYFADINAHLLDVVLECGASVQEDTEAARTFMALFDFMHAAERAGQERAIGAQGFAAGRFAPALYETFRHLKDEQDGFFKIFAAYASREQSAILQHRLADPANAEVGLLRDIAINGGLEGRLDQIDGGAWFRAATRRIDLLRQVEVTLAEKLEAAAHAKARSARTWFEIMLTGALALVVAIAALCVAAGRSLARPIRRMTQAMTALAAGDNSVAVPDLGSRNEVGRMAAAFEVFRGNAIARQQREAQITHMACHDSLTNLPNRAMFQDRIERVVAMVGRGGGAAVLCIDLDGFKAVNDTLGHFAGDQLLRIVAERLQACVRDTDTVARLGGDEFAIIQVGIARADDASILADRLLQVVGEPLELEGQRLGPRLSIGIALAPADGADAERLMKNADVALYRAKADGGHGYRFFETQMEARLQARRQLEADLRQAVALDAFELLYQPLVDAQSGRVAGFEALVRWLHPARGRMSPADFIPVAEETGLIVPLGEWILDRACADAVAWAEPLAVAVNLSPAQFKDPLLARKIAGVLARSGLAPGRLELEITESVRLLEDKAAVEALHALRAMGVRISMDDFGAGYSSLSYLRAFPFDKIKIDQSFVRDLGVTHGAEAIVRAVVMLADSLGMAVTAEGVETPSQLAKLKAEGCTQLQGYLFSRPIPVAEVPSMIERPPWSRHAERSRVAVPEAPSLMGLALESCHQGWVTSVA